MKKLLFSLLALTIAGASFAQKKADDIAKFKTDVIDMGKIPQNIPASVTFVVTNIGKEPLIIENANPTCGCTTKDFTKEPIMPGKTGTITATYNAANLNNFDKHLTVKFAGVDELKTITIKGEVLTTEDYAKYKSSKPADVKTTGAVNTKTNQAKQPKASTAKTTATKTAAKVSAN